MTLRRTSKFPTILIFIFCLIGSGCANFTPEVEHEASGQKVMISTQGQSASRAAMSMIDQGGNLIDAAAAASFVISVERPQSTGLGGGGFMLFREGKSGEIYAIDFRERAPLQAHDKMFLDANGQVIHDLSTEGILSVGVPGLVAGILEIQKKFGKLSRETIMQPAIELADKGFAVYPTLAQALLDRKSVLAKYPASAAIFLKGDGSPYHVGERLVQKDLAHTLRLIARDGAPAFYSGPIAKALLAESRRLHGVITQRDLDRYRVRWRTPVRGNYHGLEIVSMPPPSSGGTHVIEILNLLENEPLRRLGFHSTPSIDRIATAFEIAFADRAWYLGDPDFTVVPVPWLTSKSYAHTRQAEITAGLAHRTTPRQAGHEPKRESTDTTHFSMLNDQGDMIASTQTINGWMGSGVVVPGTGIVLNDEMDDFSAKPGTANMFGVTGGDANSIQPGKTPLSSMSPTFIFENGHPRMVVGAPGGSRIITCVAQTILNYFEYQLPLREAVSQVRFHDQGPANLLTFDQPGPGIAVEGELRALGYKVEMSPDGVPCRVMAAVNENGTLRGMSDPRDAGASIGR